MELTILVTKALLAHLHYLQRGWSITTVIQGSRILLSHINLSLSEINQKNDLQYKRQESLLGNTLILLIEMIQILSQ